MALRLMAILACMNPCLNGSTCIFSRWAKLAGASFLRTHCIPKFYKMNSKARVSNSIFVCIVLLHQRFNWNITNLECSCHFRSVDIHTANSLLAHAVLSDKFVRMASVGLFFFDTGYNYHCGTPIILQWRKLWKIIIHSCFYKKYRSSSIFENLTYILEFELKGTFCCLENSLLRVTLLHFYPRTRIWKLAAKYVVSHFNNVSSFTQIKE